MELLTATAVELKSRYAFIATTGCAVSFALADRVTGDATVLPLPGEQMVTVGLVLASAQPEGGGGGGGGGAEPTVKLILWLKDAPLLSHAFTVR